MSKVGFVNEHNQYLVNISEVSRVQSHFKVFYINRLQSHAIKRDERVTDLQKEEFKRKNTFKPQLAASKTTQQLAENYKLKLAQKIGLENVDVSKIERSDLLRAQGAIMQRQKEMKAQVEQEVSFKKDHTFKPNTALTRKRSVKKIEKKPEPKVATNDISIQRVSVVDQNEKFNKLYKQAKKQVEK